MKLYEKKKYEQHIWDLNLSKKPTSKQLGNKAPGPPLHIMCNAEQMQTALGRK